MQGFLRKTTRAGAECEREPRQGARTGEIGDGCQALFPGGRLGSVLWVWLGQGLWGYRRPRQAAREERQSPGWEE